MANQNASAPQAQIADTAPRIDHAEGGPSNMKFGSQKIMEPFTKREDGIRNYMIQHNQSSQSPSLVSNKMNEDLSDTVNFTFHDEVK